MGLMDDLQVKIASSENIKPSTPTPLHLKSHKLSLLDQLVSLFEYSNPSVLFYSGNGNPSQVDQLRVSLSKTLTLFYPLAGRLSADASTIECTDEGAPFIVAGANCTLSEFLGSSNRVELVPWFLSNHAVDPGQMGTGLVPLILQVTVFECGGVAIGCHLLHKALDGTSRRHFLNTWAAIAAGRGADVVAPDFGTAISIFPPVECGPEKLPVKVLRPELEGECVVKAFGFSPASIAALRANAKSEKVVNPTRVESVTGFVWKHLIAAATIPGPSAVIHSVDMRPLLHPPLPPSTYGKFVTHAITRHTNPDEQLPDLVAILHEAIRDAKDPKSISKLRSKEGERHHKKMLDDMTGDNREVMNAYFFTSWAGLEMDFGSGKPLWIGFTGGPTSSWFRNFMPLIHTPHQGFEVWLILDKQEMANLETDPEFLTFASPC